MRSIFRVFRSTKVQSPIGTVQSLPLLDGNGSMKSTNLGKLTTNEAGREILVIEIDEQKKDGVPTHVTIGDKTYQIVEIGRSVEERRFGVIYKTFAKCADRLIQRFGLKIAIKAAEWNSRVDLLTSYTFFTLISGLLTACTVGLIVHAFRGTFWKVAESISTAPVEAAKVMVEILVGGFVGIVGIVLFKGFKQFLDDSQRVLINRMKLVLRDQHPNKYYGFLDLERKFREFDDAERIEGGLVSTIFEIIPFVNFILTPLVKMYYDIKYERRQLGALKEMEAYLADIDQK